ncbi:MAG: TIGR02147 family protein [Fibrobacterota bacterium]
MIYYKLEAIMNDIYSYTNYRQYLQDFFVSKKKQNSRFSLKVFADKAGFKARDHILRVMNGQSNISYEGGRKLGLAMDLSEKELDYFSTMILFNQAKTGDAREHYFDKLSSVCKATDISRLRQDQYSYFAEWYVSALRSFLPLFNFDNDYAAIGRFFDPPISAPQVRKAIELLEQLGLLSVDKNGKYSVASLSVSTGDEVKSLALASFHRQSLELAIRSINKTQPESRDISGVTMSVSQNGFEQIKREIQAFRKKIMSIAENDRAEDRVVQCNIQLFPLTKTRRA